MRHATASLALAALLVALLACAVDGARFRKNSRAAVDIDAEESFAARASRSSDLALDGAYSGLNRANSSRRKRLPTCEPHETACRGFCADLLISDIHCGACGNVCTSSEACCNGVCTDINSNSNCGSCSNSCGEEGSCVNGLCTGSAAEALRRSLIAAAASAPAPY